jgi:hypothetical protein
MKTISRIDPGAAWETILDAGVGMAKNIDRGELARKLGRLEA